MRLKSDLARTELLYEPGTGTSYSTYGAGLLGLAISTAAGSDYDTLLHDRITGPLGMASTWQMLPESARSRLVPGYDETGGVRGPMQLNALKGCGGMISCIRDMLTWLRAIMEVNPAVSAGLGFWWRGAGLDPSQSDGWGTAVYGMDPRIGAAGRSNGYKSSYLLFPPQRVGGVILGNTQSLEIDETTERLAIRLRTLLPPLSE